MRIKKVLITFLSSGIILPLIHISIKIGTIVIESNAPISIAKVLVKAKGVKSRSSCPLKAKIGRKDTTIIIKAKNTGAPTCCALLRIVSLLSYSVYTGLWARFLCAFSIITIAASTIAPIAIAIPPKLIILDSIPKIAISKKLYSTHSGKVTMIISALLKCSKNTALTSKTITLSSSNVPKR